MAKIKDKGNPGVGRVDAVCHSARLKVYHLVAFYTALLKNQPMGFWSPAVIVHDAKHHGVTIRPVDINQSNERCIVEDGAIRLGLNYVHKLGKRGAARIVTAREAGLFHDLADFCRRVDLPRQFIENLNMIGAFDKVAGQWE